MKKTVLELASLPPAALELLTEHFDVISLDNNDPKFRETFEAALPKVHGIIGFRFPWSTIHLQNAKALEAIATISVGYDHYDLDELRDRKITLTNTPDVLTETTADLGFALLMSAARRIPELTELMKKGHWRKAIDEPYYGVDVYGKKLGIVGFGRIGQAIAKRAHFGFGMEVYYYNRSERPEAKAVNAKRVNLDILCAESDFVLVVVPLSNETTNLFGAKEFALMKKHAIFVNIARGNVVDEPALIDALKTQSILGAGLDVFQKEPLPMSSELLKLPNVVLTPHIGSATHETRNAMMRVACENLAAALKGERPKNKVV